MFHKLYTKFAAISPLQCLTALLGSVILAFGLYNIHAQSGVTEGGVLGMTLLLQHWFSISPALSSFVLNLLCYLIGWKLLGKKFLFYSAIASAGFSLFYKLFESFSPLWPDASSHPLLAALIGAVFIGVGAGLSVRAGGAPSGDDALAMSLSRITRMEIQWAYLIFDLIVLALSLSYISPARIIYSLLTVVLSGQIVGWIQKISVKNV